MKRLLTILFVLVCAVPCRAQLSLATSPAGVVQAPIDPNGWRNYKVVLSQNVTSFSFIIIPPALPPAQAVLTVEFTENATGGFTVVFDASTMASTCTIATAANAITVCQFIYDGPTGKFIGYGGAGGGGSVTGTGITNQVAFWSAGSALGGDTGLTYVPGTKSFTATGGAGGTELLTAGPSNLNFFGVNASQLVIQGNEAATTVSLSSTGNTDITASGHLNLNQNGAGSALGLTGQAVQIQATQNSADITLTGATGGNIGVTVAGANRFNFPTVTGPAGSVISTDGGNPQHLSWIANAPSFSTVIDPKSPAYGALFDTKMVWDASFVITSSTVTCPNNDCNFTNADVGKIVFGTNPATNFEAAGSVVVPQGTISTVNGAQSITVSTTANANCTAAGVQGCVLVWGHDDTAALLAAWTATINASPCAALALPVGLAIVQKGQFNTNPTNPGPCRTGAGNAWQGDAVFGVAGSFATSMLIPSPNFDFTTCTGGVDGLSCFLGSASMYATNFAIFGAGNAMSGCSATTSAKVGVEFDGGAAFADAYGINLAFTGWGSACTTAGPQVFTGVKTTSASMVGLNNVWVTGFGYTACQASPIGTGWTSIYSGNCVGGTGTASHPSGMLITGTGSPSGYVVSYGSLYGNGQGNSQAAIHFAAGTTTHFFSYGDQISQIQTGVQNTLLIAIPGATSGALAQLFGDTLLNSGGNTGGQSSDLNMSSGSIHLHGTTVSCSGAGCNTIATAVGANVFDDSGNSFSSVAGAFVGGGNLWGSPSTTGTACVSGNWALTSGWGASSIASVTAGGDSHRCQVVVTGAAGAASPVLTWTFPTAYLVAPGSCQVSFNGTLTGESSGAPSATSVAFTFTGTPSAQTYRLDSSCGP